MKKQLSIWLILLLLMGTSLACSIPFGVNFIKGSGNVVTEERDVDHFNRIVISGMGRVIINQGDEESLTIETDDNLMRYIETKVQSKTLEVGFTDDVKRKVLDPSDSLIYRINVIDLNAVDITGAGSFEIDDLNVNHLDLDLSGAANVSIDSLIADDLVVTISGAGNLDLTGQVVTQEINLDGMGRYNALDLESQTAEVRIDGAGNAKIWVYESLNVIIGGAGSVDYYGNPNLTKDISGAGSVTHLGDK